MERTGTNSVYSDRNEVGGDIPPNEIVSAEPLCMNSSTNVGGKGMYMWTLWLIACKLE